MQLGSGYIARPVHCIGTAANRVFAFFSICAPVHRDPCWEVLTPTFLELVTILDMQVLRIIMGNVNGSVCLIRDYSKGDRFGCPMLARLLGPGGPFS